MKKTIAVFFSLFVCSCYESSDRSGADGSNDLRRDPEPAADIPYDRVPHDPVPDPGVDVFPDIFPDVILDPVPDPGMDMPVCPPPLTLCGGVCVDTMNDPNNCGGCGMVCPDGSLCIGGMCVPMDPCEGIICADGLSCCEGECVDLMRDPDHCGGCGLVCPFGTSDPGLNMEGCLMLELGVYNLCCRGRCLPVDDRHCGDCRSSCDPGGTCNGVWDHAAEACTFMCFSIFSGVGQGCIEDRDCSGIPSPERTCLTDLMGFTFPGGYCSARCTSSEDCGPGATCVDIMVEQLCFKDCRGDDDCRVDEGYACMEMPYIGGGPYCLPGYY
jgi:hypothetical protein